jgi:hypothetical protein
MVLLAILMRRLIMEKPKTYFFYLGYSLGLQEDSTESEKEITC